MDLGCGRLLNERRSVVVSQCGECLSVLPRCPAQRPLWLWRRFSANLQASCPFPTDSSTVHQAPPEGRRSHRPEWRIWQLPFRAWKSASPQRIPDPTSSLWFPPRLLVLGHDCAQLRGPGDSGADRTTETTVAARVRAGSHDQTLEGDLARH